MLAAYARIRGHYAFVAVSADEPELLVGARKECPLVIGRGEGEQFVASAIPAFLAHTRQVQLIENDEIVVVRRDGVEFLSAAGEPIERAVDEVDWSQEVAEKGGYETFMLKEIHEQADAVAETIADRTVRAATASTSASSARSTTPSCATATASSSSPAAPRTTPA